MIVGFREYDGKPSPEWLEVGAVLVGPDGVQYENVKVGSYSSRWKVVGDEGEGVSSERMCELVGDGAGWLIAENVPDVLYIVVDTSCGGIGVGQWQGASRVRAFFSRERAEKAIKNMDRWSNTSSYRVVEYKMSERNM